MPPLFYAYALVVMGMAVAVYGLSGNPKSKDGWLRIITGILALLVSLRVLLADILKWI